MILELLLGANFNVAEIAHLRPRLWLGLTFARCFLPLKWDFLVSEELRNTLQIRHLYLSALRRSAYFLFCWKSWSPKFTVTVDRPRNVVIQNSTYDNIPEIRRRRRTTECYDNIGLRLIPFWSHYRMDPNWLTEFVWLLYSELKTRKRVSKKCF